MSEKSKKKPASNIAPVKETKKKRVSSPTPPAQSSTPASTPSRATSLTAKERDVTKGTPPFSPSANFITEVPTTWAASPIRDILKGKGDSTKTTAAATLRETPDELNFKGLVLSYG
eukprot:8784663-Heterocapsa_arctica.AAC.1